MNTFKSLLFTLSQLQALQGIISESWETPGSARSGHQAGQKYGPSAGHWTGIWSEDMSYYAFFASKLTMVHLKVLGVGQSRIFCGVRWKTSTDLGGREWGVEGRVGTSSLRSPTSQVQWRIWVRLTQAV